MTAYRPHAAMLPAQPTSAPAPDAATGSASGPVSLNAPTAPAPLSPEATKANAYLTTRVMTASPAELRLMLIDGAIKFIRQGRDALAKRDFEGCYNGYSRGRAIITELLTSMRPEPDRELYDRMTALYAYMLKRLVESSFQKDIASADEVLGLLDFDRETWKLLVERLGSEQRADTRPTAAPVGDPDTLDSSLSVSA